MGGDPSPHTHRVYRHEAIQRERPNKEKTSILTRQLPMLSSVSYNLRQAWLFFLKTQQFLVDVSVIDRQGCACVRTLWFRKMSTLLIARTSGSIADSFRPYQVFVDGIRRGCVSVNETLLISVEPGIHSVRFGIDFYSSLPLMVHASEGETSITCRSTTRRLFGLLSLFTPNTWIMTLVREYSDLPRSLPQPRAAMRKASAEAIVFGPYLPKAFLHRYRLAR